jgi:5-methyltetrahydrofolate--homocysteine methyltransferase
MNRKLSLLRDTRGANLVEYIILVGGAPLNEEFGAAIGADAYCRDAAVASETAKALVSAKRGRTEPPGPSV